MEYKDLKARLAHRQKPVGQTHLVIQKDTYLLVEMEHPGKPKLNEVLRLIARLGGLLGRKGDGEPGVKTIWLGLNEVHVAAKARPGLRQITHIAGCV